MNYLIQHYGNEQNMFLATASMYSPESDLLCMLINDVSYYNVKRILMFLQYNQILAEEQ